MEAKESLPHQGLPRPFPPTKHSECSKGCFSDKTGRGNPWSSKIFKDREHEEEREEGGKSFSGVMSKTKPF